MQSTKYAEEGQEWLSRSCGPTISSDRSIEFSGDRVYSS